MSTKQTWSRVLQYTKKYKKSVIWAMISAIVSVVASLIGPYLIGRAIDQMVGPNEVYFGVISSILISLAFIYTIGSIFTWVLTYLSNQIAYCTINDMRADLFDHIDELPLKFHDRHPHGDAISRFVNDMDAISDGLLQGISTLLTGIVTIVGAVGFMLYVNPLMTLVVVLSAPVTFFVARYITRRSQRLFKEQAQILGQLNGYIEEMIGGAKVVKAFYYEQRAEQDFKALNQTLYDTGVKSQFASSLSNPTTRLVNNITFSAIAIIGSIAVIMARISVGDLSSFLIYANLFAKPFNEITGVLTQLQSATASAERIFAIMDMEVEEPDSPQHYQVGQNKGQSKGVIEFNHVKFAYVPERPLITDFSLTVQPGTRIAIVGQTGAGKTTLVNLLMRFYDVDAGTITIDGVNIKDINRDSLRRNFGMVLQETWLFDGTIRDNIAYGKSDASDEEVIAAAKAANAHSFIKRLPEGYNTRISGTGDNLSQGQKQLLTIARVMLVDPPMLILDEATSSIDTLTEVRIQKAFLKMIEGRTSFVIAHRLSTIREADLILFMKNGDVVESGSHDELLQRGGYYASLYNSQFAAV